MPRPLRSQGGRRFGDLGRALSRVGSVVLPVVAVWITACGGLVDMMAADEGLQPPACDLVKLARSLVGPIESCPPGEVIVQTATGTTRHRGQPAWNGEQACTRFIIEGGGCSDPCAPALCWLDGETVECDPSCSDDRTTCFVLPPSACATP